MENLKLTEKQIIDLEMNTKRQYQYDECIWSEKKVDISYFFNKIISLY